MCGGCSLIFLSLSAKKEEEDTEDKKSIKKRIKELKVLDPKIAQNLCKYLFPFYLLLKKVDLYTFIEKFGMLYTLACCYGN